MKRLWRRTAWVLLIVTAICAGIYVALPDDISIYSGQTPPKHSLYSVSLAPQSALSAPRSAADTGQYVAKLKLFDLLPIKTVRIDVIQKQKLRLGGQAFGIRLYTEGVIVVGCGNFLCNGETVCPAEQAGIRIGDRLTVADGQKIESNEQLASLLEQRSTPVKLTVVRKNMKFDTTITPIMPDGDDNYRIGLWVRDSTAGIGTLTYYNTDTGNFAGLGHAVADIDTGELMPSAAGSIVTADINHIEKSKDGKAGLLEGTFGETKLGELLANTDCGIFAKGDDQLGTDTVDIALKGEIRIGEAQIYTQLDGKAPEYYNIEIVKINNNLSENKNMVIRVTDPELLKKTGGIVQGMSGSPIVQNGKLIGAVTHVFVSEPTKGYGIFIEKMLLCENELKNK